MTDLLIAESPVTADDPAAQSDPNVLYTAYFSTVAEVVEATEAADRLGLGVRIESYAVADPESADGSHTEFEFTLLADLPQRSDDGD